MAQIKGSTRSYFLKDHLGSSTVMTNTWWREVKYPIHLTLTANGGTIKDQDGYICTLKKIIYDPDEDEIVFRHCGMKHEDIDCDDLFRIIQLVKFKDDKLLGEVRSYKMLFRWVGKSTRVIKETERG